MIKQLSEQLKLELTPMQRLEKLNLIRDLTYKEELWELHGKACTRLIEYANSTIASLPVEDMMRVKTMLKDTHTQHGARNFNSFLIAMEWDRPVEKRFYQPRMKILAPVVQDLQDLSDGEIDIYLLSLPPRVGKTTIGLFYIAFISGRFPNDSTLGTGYASSLVKTFYQGVSDFFSSPDYRFQEIFPYEKMHTSAIDMTIDIGVNERYKTVAFRSLDGTITGAVEAKNLLYLDDTCSGIQEAMNLNRLDTLWQKVSVDLQQRRVLHAVTHRAAPMLVIGTLWSVHDAIGRLQAIHKDNPMCRVRRIPALDNNDESNFDYDDHKGFTSEQYHNLREGMDTVSWECVYQQNPIERDGLLFPSDELQYYLDLPNYEPDNIIAACDVAFGGADFLSFPVIYQYGDTGYLVDVVFEAGKDYKITQPMIVDMLQKRGIQQAHFEANRGGDFYARDVIDLLKTTGHTCNITYSLASNTSSKLARIVQYAPDIRNIMYPDKSLYSHKSGMARFMTNLTTFLQTGASKHDDAPDSMCIICSRMKNNMANSISSPFARPF